MVYLPTFTIQISQMWATIPYMDDMGMGKGCGATKKKKTPTFHYTGWLIGIIIMVY